jgi:hypothetical protein
VAATGSSEAPETIPADGTITMSTPAPVTSPADLQQGRTEPSDTSVRSGLPSRGHGKTTPSLTGEFARSAVIDEDSLDRRLA